MALFRLKKRGFIQIEKRQNFPFFYSILAVFKSKLEKLYFIWVFIELQELLHKWALTNEQRHDRPLAQPIGGCRQTGAMIDPWRNQ